VHIYKTKYARKHMTLSLIHIFLLKMYY